MKKRHSKSGERIAAAPRQRTHEEIARLAYSLYEQEGRPDGKALEHWFNAESMIEGNFGYGQDHAEHDFSKDSGDD